MVLLALWAGCQDHTTASPDDRAARPGAAVRSSETVTGTVRYIDLEGGFYGFVTDDGKKLDLVNLPAEFQKDGVRLQARVEEVPDHVSLRMWGRPVRIIEFKRL